MHFSVTSFKWHVSLISWNLPNYHPTKPPQKYHATRFDKGGDGLQWKSYDPMTGASGWGRWFDVVDQLSLEPRGEAMTFGSQVPTWSADFSNASKFGLVESWKDEAIRVSGDCNTFSVNSVNGGCLFDIFIPSLKKAGKYRRWLIFYIFFCKVVFFFATQSWWFGITFLKQTVLRNHIRTRPPPISWSTWVDGVFFGFRNLASSSIYNIHIYICIFCEMQLWPLDSFSCV